jgi:hypothetical protein
MYFDVYTNDIPDTEFDYSILPAPAKSYVKAWFAAWPVHNLLNDTSRISFLTQLLRARALKGRLSMVKAARVYPRVYSKVPLY